MNTHTRRVARWPTIAPLGLALACTTNNPIAVTPEPDQLSQYLEAHPSSDLQITDKAGHRFWLHDPVVRNDSLTGIANRNEPTIFRGVRLDEIQGLAQPHYDVASTVGLGIAIFAGMAAVAALSMEGEESIMLPAEAVR